MTFVSDNVTGFLRFVVSLYISCFASLNSVSNYSHAIVFIRFSKVGLV
jgi:hypothetical protein